MALVRLALCLFMLSVAGSAQIYKINPLPGRPVPLLTTSVTVTASPSTVNFTLVKGSVVTGNQSITIGSSWTLALAGTVKLYGYFLSSTNALVNSTNSSYSIPSSHILGLCTTGNPTTYTAFSQAGSFGSNSSLLIYSQGSILGLFVNRTDSLSLRIDLTSQPQLPAGTYTGTLILQAQAL